MTTGRGGGAGRLAGGAGTGRGTGAGALFTAAIFAGTGLAGGILAGASVAGAALLAAGLFEVTGVFEAIGVVLLVATAAAGVRFGRAAEVFFVEALLLESDLRVVMKESFLPGSMDPG